MTVSEDWTDEDRAEFNAWITSAADGPADECPLCASHPDHPCLFHIDGTSGGTDG